MKALLLIIVSFFTIYAFSQNGTVFIATQTYPIPEKLDTFRVIIQYSDTTNSRGIFYYQAMYQKKALMVVGGTQWTPVYLDTNKKRLSKNILVWNAIGY